MKVERRRNQEQPRGLAEATHGRGNSRWPGTRGVPRATGRASSNPGPATADERLQTLSTRSPPAARDGRRPADPARPGRRRRTREPDRTPAPAVGWRRSPEYAPYLRFEPGFRVSAIQRISAIGRVGTTGAVTARRRAFDGTSASSSRACRAREFQTVHAKAQFAIAALDGFYIRASRASGGMERPPPVGLQVRIEISVVAQIHSFFEPLHRHIRKRDIARPPDPGTTSAGRWSWLAARRKIENQALHSERRLAPAQIVEPDQPESENAIGMAGIRRGADGRPCRRALPQQCARISRREACVPDRLRWSARQVCRRETDGAEIAGTVREIQAGRFAEARCRARARRRSISSRVPWSFPKRATLSTSLPRVSRSMAVTRRTRLRRWSQACSWTHAPRTSSTKFSGVIASHSSPGSHSTGSWLDSRKRSMARRISRPEDFGHL